MNTKRKIRQMNRQFEQIENSDLSKEEKAAAINSYRKMLATTLIFVGVLTIIIGIAIAVAITISIELGAVVALLAMVLMIIVLIVFAVSMRKKRGLN